MDLGTFYVDIYNYDSNKSTKVYYQKSADGSMAEYKGPATNYYNYDKNGHATLAFFRESNITGFVDSYTRNGSCPTLYYSTIADSMPRQDVVETRNVNPTESPNAISPSALYLKGPDDTDWVSEKEFKDRTKSEQVKPESGQEDKTCSYKMNFEGTHNAVDVIFKRKFNADSGKVSYSIKIDSKEMEVKDLNSDFDHNGGVSNVGAGIDNVRIKSAVLKKVLEGDKCIDADKIYHYKDDGINYYVITLDKQDVEDGSFSDKIGDGNGDEPDTGEHNAPKPPDYEMGKHLNCKDLLGKDLTAIVKAAIRIMQIVAAIIAILKGMITVIPAVAAKDADALKKASKTLITMAIILLIVLLLPLFVKVIGQMLDFDLSCFL